MAPATLEERGEGKGPGPYLQVSTLEGTPAGKPIFIRPSSERSDDGGLAATHVPLKCGGCNEATDLIKYTSLPSSGQLCKADASVPAGGGGCNPGYVAVSLNDELTIAQAREVTYVGGGIQGRGTR
jgi:hypothetical protein